MDKRYALWCLDRCRRVATLAFAAFLSLMRTHFFNPHHPPPISLAMASVADLRPGAASATAHGGRVAGVQQWRPLVPSIYRVPTWIRDANSSAYTPRFVSFGPYHHGATERLRSMEKYKHDALTRFSGRADKSEVEIKTAIRGLLNGLMDSYDGLDEKWRDDQGGAFLDLMTLDGCFLLEILYSDWLSGQPATEDSNDGYPENHLLFGRKRAYLVKHIRTDMLLLENQLPLKLLQELAVLLPAGESNVDKIMLNFLAHGKLLLEPESEQRVPPPLTTLGALFFTMPMYYVSAIDAIAEHAAKLLLIMVRYLSMTASDMIRILSTELLRRRIISEEASVESPLLPVAEGRPVPSGSLLSRLCGLLGIPRGEEEVEALVPEAEATHLLDVYKRSMLAQGQSSRCAGGRVPFSAEQLSNFGVQFQVADTGSFQGVQFGHDHRKVSLEFFYVVPLILLLPPLRLPVMKVDDDTVPTLLNLMAFESLYHGTGDEVNDYLLLMGSLLRTVEDVDALFRDGIIQGAPGQNGESVHRIFTELMRQASPVDVPDRGELYSEVSAYCNSRVARIVRWFHRSKPPPLVGHILSILALAATLFSVIAGLISKQKGGTTNL